MKYRIQWIAKIALPSNFIASGFGRATYSEEQAHREAMTLNRSISGKFCIHRAVPCEVEELIEKAIELDT